MLGVMCMHSSLPEPANNSPHKQGQQNCDASVKPSEESNQDHRRAFRHPVGRDLSAEVPVNLISDGRDDETEDKHPCDKRNPADSEGAPNSTASKHADKRKSSCKYGWCKCDDDLGSGFHDA